MSTRPLFRKALTAPRFKAAAVVAALTVAAALGLSLYDGAFLARGWPLVAGALFGVVLQRTELSLVRAWRDCLFLRDSDQLFGLVVALGVAALLTLGGMIALGVSEPPHGARIGPVSWILPVAAFAFGLGAVVARGSLMVHLRRLGEGSLVAVPALAATFAGFVLAIAMWPWAYAHALGGAPAPWLPAIVGLPAALALEVAALALFGALFWRMRPEPLPCEHATGRRVLVDPWPAAPGAALIGVIAAASYAAGEPLGLASECAAVARWVATVLGLAPAALPGLDTGIGGLVVPLRFLGFSGHVVIVTGVLLGACAAGLASGHFRVVGMTGREAVEMIIGGLLIGWGAMIGLGTVTGAVVSGIAVGAASGWVFLVFSSAGVVIGLKLDRRPAMTALTPEPADASQPA